MRYSSIYLFFYLLFFSASACQDRPVSPSNEPVKLQVTAENIPEYVLNTLAYVEAHQAAPAGYVGGRTFENREKRLPKSSSDGQLIRYKEWDVHPKTPGKNRGPERLVTGSEKSAWFTSDHYKSFKKIK